jgi:hypothetical protein
MLGVVPIAPGFPPLYFEGEGKKHEYTNTKSQTMDPHRLDSMRLPDRIDSGGGSADHATGRRH